MNTHKKQVKTFFEQHLLWIRPRLDDKKRHEEAVLFKRLNGCSKEEYLTDSLISLLERQRQRQEDKTQRKSVEELTEALILDVGHMKDKENRRQRDADHITAARRKVDQAIEKLEKTKTPEGKHLLLELQKVREQWAAPTQKRDIARVYYHFPTIYDDPQPYSVETERKKKTGDQSEFLFLLYSFWIKEFNEKPTRYRGHPFFELAGILLDVDADSAHRQWLRSAKINPSP